MNPPAADVGERDPSKLSLITPGGGEYHLTKGLFLSVVNKGGKWLK